MLQISDKVYCDELFNSIEVENKILPNPYKEYPYLIIENFLSPEFLQEIASSIQASTNLKKAKVKIQTDNGIIDNELNEIHRKTNIYFFNDEQTKFYHNQFLKYKKEIENFYNVVLTNSTEIQALEYKQGYFYVKHADDSSELVDDDGNTVGFLNVAPQRKLTTVLFCTNCDDYEGGELKFNYLYDKDGNCKIIKPNAGDMIVFPSNPIYSHEVMEVKSGYRLTAVQWHDAMVL